MPQRKRQKILIVAPEVFPQMKVGGLGQFVAGVVKSLKKKNVDVKLVTPQESVYFLPCLPITQLKFKALAQKALNFCQQENWQPDLVWAHDWSGIAVLEKFQNQPAKTIWTVHSPLVDGYYYYGYAEEPDSEPVDWSDDFFDFQTLVETGFQLADEVNTVSPTYGRQVSSSFDRKVIGISNGLDFSRWHPQKDKLLDTRLQNGDWQEFKKRNKIALQRFFQLPVVNQPVFCFVSRLSPQKGIDLFYQTLPKFMAQNKVQMVIVGQGMKKYHRFFEKLKKEFPTQVGLKLKVDFDLPHQVFAGADFLVLPSRTEPGGIVVQEAAAYGALPIVHLTGGLKDQVKDGDSGLGFDCFSSSGLEAKLHQSLDLYSRPAIWEMRKKAQEKVRNWDQVTCEYLEWFNEGN